MSNPIPLPYTRDSLLQLLQFGSEPDSASYSHKQIAEWCDKFWCQYLDVEAPNEIEKLLPIFTDVEIQWDLYLANKFSVEEIRSGAVEQERMPLEWFKEWLNQVRD